MESKEDVHGRYDHNRKIWLYLKMDGWKYLNLMLRITKKNNIILIWLHFNINGTVTMKYLPKSTGESVQRQKGVRFEVCVRRRQKFADNKPSTLQTDRKSPPPLLYREAKHNAGKYQALLWSPALSPSQFVSYKHNQLSCKQTWQLHPATAISSWITWQRCIRKSSPQSLQPRAETVRVVWWH